MPSKIMGFVARTGWECTPAGGENYGLKLPQHKRAAPVTQAQLVDLRNELIDLFPLTMREIQALPNPYDGDDYDRRVPRPVEPDSQ